MYFAALLRDQSFRKLRLSSCTWSIHTWKPATFNFYVKSTLYFFLLKNLEGNDRPVTMWSFPFKVSKSRINSLASGMCVVGICAHFLHNTLHVKTPQYMWPCCLSKSCTWTTLASSVRRRMQGCSATLWKDARGSWCRAAVCASLHCFVLNKSVTKLSNQRTTLLKRWCVVWYINGCNLEATHGYEKDWTLVVMSKCWRSHALVSIDNENVMLNWTPSRLRQFDLWQFFFCMHIDSQQKKWCCRSCIASCLHLPCI